MSIYTPVVKDGETRRVLQLRSPIDLEPIGELVCASREDVQGALARARAAQPGWAAKSFADALAVEKVADAIRRSHREGGWVKP